jgi:hypothetical protein
LLFSIPFLFVHSLPRSTREQRSITNPYIFSANFAERAYHLNPEETLVMQPFEFSRGTATLYF